jgi:hypothetical protein
LQNHPFFDTPYSAYFKFENLQIFQHFLWKTQNDSLKNV